MDVVCSIGFIIGVVIGIPSLLFREYKPGIIFLIIGSVSLYSLSAFDTGFENYKTVDAYPNMKISCEYSHISKKYMSSKEIYPYLDYNYVKVIKTYKAYRNNYIFSVGRSLIFTSIDDKIVKVSSSVGYVYDNILFFKKFCFDTFTPAEQKIMNELIIKMGEN